MPTRDLHAPRRNVFGVPPTPDVRLAPRVDPRPRPDDTSFVIVPFGRLGLRGRARRHVGLRYFAVRIRRRRHRQMRQMPRSPLFMYTLPTFPSAPRAREGRVTGRARRPRPTAPRGQSPRHKLHIPHALTRRRHETVTEVSERSRDTARRHGASALERDHTDRRTTAVPAVEKTPTVDRVSLRPPRLRVTV